ncbi:10008_t:CDS:2 [Gigaspora margarita]|uniref:10008_t:CDS:1 n=1 Tax=Gigaspora margarita TaxID=4874 RepID=A0ABN7UXW8_GIGMA|nr:10008_t:CDS:2 [Gigaspora margarita]
MLPLDPVLMKQMNVDNCPADLALLLYYFHEVLEGRGEKLLEQEQWQKKVIEKWEFNPNGKAEEGRETFQKIVNNIDNYNLFPEDETIPDDDSPEAQAAIKELEGLLEEK